MVRRLRRLGNVLSSVENGTRQSMRRWVKHSAWPPGGNVGEWISAKRIKLDLLDAFWPTSSIFFQKPFRPPLS